MNKIFLLLIINLISVTIRAQVVNVRGAVFNDKNSNGIKDEGEKGIPNVVVSNQKDVVITNKKGQYMLETEKESGCIFVCKPADYQYLLDDNNIPMRHYVHRTKGSPDYLRYAGLEPSGEWPIKINFPLIESKEKKQFRASIVADPQTYTEEQVDWYTRNVLSLVTRDNADMYIVLGDIAWDNLDTYYLMNEATKFLNRPVYTVVGNHDLNFRSPDRFHAMETYMRIYGPDYYSFNEGDVHFVTLNSVSYHGWQKEKNSRGYYHGELHEKQLQWLKNDLEHVPADKLIVLLMHIPVNLIKDRKAMFEILEGRRHLLALAGHEHLVIHNDINETDTLWNGGDFHLHVAGSGSGMRYGEARDIVNVPSGLSMDAAPQGYYLYSFDNSSYGFDFVAEKRWTNRKMHIASPSGVISGDSIQSVQVVANIYDGDNKTEVNYWINGNGPYKMEQFSDKDPYYGSHFWVAKTGHLWKAALPDNLPTGTHLIKVVATDRFHSIWSDEMMFRVRK